MDHRTGYLMGKYEIGRFLGQGTSAKVFYAKSLDGKGHGVAVKIIDKDKIAKLNSKNQIKREISVMRMVKHPNIVNLYEVMASRTKIYLVIEYAKGGELFDKVKKGKLPEELAHKYFKQLINAIDFCHSKGVYHRDIKPENLLLDGNQNLKVSDFGLSALTKSRRRDGLFHTACGTPAYVSPEVINQKGYDGAKSDIWSCGVVLFVLLAGYLPFHDKNLMDMYRKICKADVKYPKGFSLDACELLTRIFDPKPESRISIAEIRKTSWFRADFTKKTSTSEPKGKRNPSVNTKGNPGPSSSAGLDSKPNKESIRPTKLNAFGIVSVLDRFDFSGSFEENDAKDGRFTSSEPLSVIISRLFETAKFLRFRMKQIDESVLKLEALKAGKMGLVSIDVEIFEVSETLHLVEMRKSSGDTTEYQVVMEEGIKPALRDIVLAWQGEKQHQR